MKKFGKSTNILKLNNTLLTNSWVKEEITQEIRKCYEMNKNKIPKFMGCSQNSTLREIYCCKNHYQKSKKNSNFKNCFPN